MAGRRQSAKSVLSRGLNSLMGRVWLVFVTLLGLSACVNRTVQPIEFTHPDYASCVAEYVALESQVEHGFFSPIAGIPFLRLNRSLANFSLLRLDLKGRLAWLQWSHNLAREHFSLADVDDSVCSEGLLRSLAGDDDYIRVLAKRAVIADDYQTWQRWLGIYPLTRIPFVWGVKNELAATRHRQERYKSANIHDRAWTLYPPSFSPGVASVIDNRLIDSRFHLSVSSLLQVWAPTFAIEADSSGASTPGQIFRDGAGALQFEPSSPAPLYSYLSVGEYKGQQTLQLNYQIWFAERPQNSSLDMLSGRLDGIQWRVHLNYKLEAIAFDAMHTCGCWYQLYPAEGYSVENGLDYWQEPFFVGDAVSAERAQTLLLTQGTHSLVGVRLNDLQHGGVPTGRVDLSPASVGLSTALSDLAKRYRRVFDAQGIVPETRRSERFYFWPMGIPQAGSMRAPGHHAIAFTGRRQFDAPNLLDQLGLKKD